MIYFVQAGNGGPIKIGRTGDLGSRLRELQTASPFELSLLGVMPEESDLHQAFQDGLIRGEWFQPTHQLMEYIERFAQREPNQWWGDKYCRNLSHRPGCLNALSSDEDDPDGD